MPRPSPLSAPVALALLASALLGGATAQDPGPGPQPAAPQPKSWGPDDLKPKPPGAIPDDPPPHEGAMVDLAYVIEPPDLLIVEVLEALPGRPITGERLVRPDGTISLGFYGDVAVRGLTMEQAKVKIIRRLQQFIPDDVLGLTRHVVIEKGDAGAPPLPEPGRSPFEVPPDAPAAAKPPAIPPPADATPAPAEGPKAKAAASARRRARPGRPESPAASRRAARRRRTVAQAPAPGEKAGGDPPKEMAKPEGAIEMIVNEEDVVVEAIDPAESIRVFVDVASYNSQVYYVQGDVGVPGRLPVTGGETVMDALQYSGGLTPSAEPADLHLYRPARGGKPAREYKLDLAAITRGDAAANLQMFPNDRLVVGRNAVVKRTIEIDRAAAPINSILNNLLQRSFTTRSMGLAAGEINGTVTIDRDAALRGWSEFLWDLSSKEGDATLDDKAFREAVMKRLGPPPAPAPAPR